MSYPDPYKHFVSYTGECYWDCLECQRQEQIKYAKEISKSQECKYAKELKVGDRVEVNQVGVGHVTKIDYETGDVWVDNMNEAFLPISAGSVYKLKQQKRIKLPFGLSFILEY